MQIHGLISMLSCANIVICQTASALLLISVKSSIYDTGLKLTLLSYSLYTWISRSFMKARRVTIMIEDDFDKKLRLIQAKLIQKNQSSCSYSKVINQILGVYFRKNE